MATPAAPTSAPAGRQSFWQRVRGAMLLDAATYEDIERDPHSLREAAGVVGLGAMAGALGLSASLGGSGGVMASVFGAGVGWFLSTAVVWLVGVRLLGHSSDYQELLRTLGFASAPHLVLALGIVPGLGRLAPLVSLWALVAYVVAVRQALDVGTGRALLVCVLAYAAVPLCITLFVALLAFLALS
jgi:hypothetical protein